MSIIGKKYKTTYIAGMFTLVAAFAGCGGGGGGGYEQAGSPQPAAQVETAPAAVQIEASNEPAISGMIDVFGAAPAGTAAKTAAETAKFGNVSITVNTIGTDGKLSRVAGTAEYPVNEDGTYKLPYPPAGKNLVMATSGEITAGGVPMTINAMKLFTTDETSRANSVTGWNINAATTLTAETVKEVIAAINGAASGDKKMQADELPDEEIGAIVNLTEAAIASAQSGGFSPLSFITSVGEKRAGYIADLNNTPAGASVFAAASRLRTYGGVRVFVEDETPGCKVAAVSIKAGSWRASAATDEHGLAYYFGLPVGLEIEIQATGDGCGTARQRFTIQRPGEVFETKIALDKNTADPLPAAAAVAQPSGKVLQYTAVTLSSEGSFDPDGNPLSYKWEKTSGPDVELDNNSGATAKFTAVKPGVYVFTLVVTDAKGSSAKAGVSVEVEPNGCAADADCADSDRLTIDQCVKPGTNESSCEHKHTACLSDSDCGDENPATADRCVAAVDGSAQCANAALTARVDETSLTLSDGRAQTGLVCSMNGETGGVEARCREDGEWKKVENGVPTECIYSSPGVYAPECRAGGEAAAKPESAITVYKAPNIPPSVKISTDATYGVAPLTVQLNSECEDTDGACVSYTWDFGDGSPTAFNETLTHTYSKGGNYIVRITAIDDQGAEVTATAGVKINTPPAALISMNLVEGNSPQTVAFNGGCVDEEDGSACANYTWNFGDGTPEVNGQFAEHSYETGGNFTVELRTADGQGAWGSATAPIKINTPPAVKANADATSGAAPMQVNFSSTCFDPDGECVSYMWNFGDGSPTAGASNASHVYNNTGTYEATLTAYDADGAQSSSIIVISVWRNGAVMITATLGDHTCVLMGGGTVKCWGSNSYGQLGDGTTTNRATPVSTVNLTDATSISAGKNHTCALTKGGTVKCWGQNDKGQLGNGTKTNSYTPVTVSGVSGASAIALGRQHSCAIINNGIVKCWGSNYYGQLGNGSNIDSLTPVEVSGVTHAEVLAAGQNTTCAQVSSGPAKCWGENDYYNIGNGTLANKNTPTEVYGVSGVKAFAIGSYSTCAIITGGTVMCWGGKSSLGGVGDGTNTDRPTPVKIDSLTGAETITAGTGHLCAVLQGGSVACWGYNVYGQVGDGTYEQRNAPVQVGGVSGATDISAGSYYSCALINGGEVKCWGQNNRGQLGDGGQFGSQSPVIVAGM